jgi:hypothetical protein
MPLPRNFSSYYRRFLRQVRTDLFQWGRGQVIGAVVTLAILLLELYFGVVPKSMTVAALESFGWPYLAVIAVFLMGTLLKAPVELDNQRASQVFQATEALQRKQEENRTLHDRLAAPLISTLEQGRRDLVADKLKDATPLDIEVLTHVLHHGQVDDIAFIRDAPQDEQKLYRDAVGCGYFGTTAKYQKNQTIRVIRSLCDGRLEPGYGYNPGFLRSVGLGLGQFGLIPEDGLREVFKTAEQGLELSILPGGSLV